MLYLIFLFNKFKVAMTLALAKTTFASGITDELATVDVYTQTSALEPIDVISSDLSIDPIGLEGMMGGNLEEPGVLITSLSDDGLLVFDEEALLSGVIASNPDLLSAKGQLSSEISDEICKASDFADVTATIDGIKSEITSANLSDLTGVSSMIASISKAEFPISFTDITGLSNLGTNLLSKAIDLGIPNAYSQIAKGLTENLDILSNITKNILPKIISNSSVDVLMQIADGPIGKMVGSMRPNLIRDVAQVFKFPPRTSQNKLPSIAKKLGSSFTKIDPNWNKTILPNGKKINKSDALSKASDDMKMVMKAAQFAAKLPMFTKPKTTLDQTQEQFNINPPPAPPDGSTTITSTEIDGSIITETTFPDGTIRTVLERPDGTVRTTTRYAVQQFPILPEQEDTNLVAAPRFTEEDYELPTDELGNPLVVDPVEVGYLDPANWVFPPDGVQTNYADSAGDTFERVKLSSGVVVMKITRANGDQEIIELNETDDDSADPYEIPEGDPLSSTSAFISDDPFAMAGVMDDFSGVDELEAANNGTNSLLTSDADTALFSSFPMTDLGGIDSVDFA